MNGDLDADQVAAGGAGRCKGLRELDEALGHGIGEAVGVTR